MPQFWVKLCPDEACAGVTAGQVGVLVASMLVKKSPGLWGQRFCLCNVNAVSLIFLDIVVVLSFPQGVWLFVRILELVLKPVPIQELLGLLAFEVLWV